MIPPEVAQVPVALVLHKTDHLLVWEGRARGSCLRLPLGLGSGLRPQRGPGQDKEGGWLGLDPRPLTRKVSKECPELCDIRGEGDICVQDNDTGQVRGQGTGQH